MVKITQVGTLHEVRFAYSPEIIEACKMLGGKWDKVGRCWVLSDAGSAQLLNRAVAYRDSLVPTSSTTTSSVGAKIRDAVSLLLRQKDAGVDLAFGLENPHLLTPDPMREAGKELKDFQIEPVRCLNTWGNLLLADSMGCGKTIEAISCINAAPDTKRVLIICPANLKHMWLRSLRGDSFSGEPGWLKDSSLTVGVAQGSYFPPTDVVVINFDILDRHKTKIDSIEWDFCIVDECHYIRNPRAKRTKCIIGGGTKKAQIKPIRAGRKLGLSGTPLVNKPEEIWAVLHWLAPREWPSRYWFEQKFCGIGRKVIGKEWDAARQLWVPKYAREVLPPSLEQLKELNQRLRSTIMLRRTKKEVLSHLPPKLRQVIEFEIPGASKLVQQERKLVESAKAGAAQLRADLASARVSGSDEEYRAAIKALTDYMRKEQAHVARIRHDLAVAKVPYVVDHVRNALLQEDQKVVVFAHHRKALKSLFNQFQEAGYNPVLLMGGVSRAEKEAAESRFQSDPTCRVFVGGLTAAGVGLTLTKANLVVFAELDWVPGNVTQCEDRCIAEGQPVLTPDGWVPIESIAVGDTVIGGDGLPHRVLDAWSKLNLRKNMTKVVVGGWGEEIETTYDHRYLIDGEWREAGTLQPGDMISNPNPHDRPNLGSLPFPDSCRLPTTFNHRNGTEQRNGRLVTAPESIELSPEALFAMGYYVGDGFSAVGRDKGRFVSFSGHQEKDAEAHCIIRKWMESLGVNLTTRNDPTGRGMEMRAYSGEWALWFHGQFGHGAHNKNLPDWVFNLSNAQIEEFVRGMCAADGYLRGNRQEYITVSKKLQSQLMRLNWALGRRCSLTFQSCGAGVVSWSLSHNQRCGKVLEVVHTGPKRSGGGLIRVYDLTVEGCHSFVVGPAVVHNCHRIGSEIHQHILVQHLVAYGSLDARIAKTLVKKQEILDAVLDDTSSLTPQEPIDWLTESRDQDYTPTREEMEAIQIDDYHKTVYSYGLKRLVDRPKEYGITDADLIVASRLANRELSGPEAAMAQFLARKYLGESA